PAHAVRRVAVAERRPRPRSRDRPLRRPRRRARRAQGALSRASHPAERPRAFRDPSCGTPESVPRPVLRNARERSATHPERRFAHNPVTSGRDRLRLAPRRMDSSDAHGALLAEFLTLRAELDATRRDARRAESAQLLAKEELNRRIIDAIPG